MTTKTVYARFDDQLYSGLRLYSDSEGCSMSSAVAQLVSAGLVAMDDQEPKEGLRKRLRDAEETNAQLAAQLTRCRANESLVLSAKFHAATLEREVAAYRERIRQMDLLPERQRTPTTLELLRDGAAVVGTVTIVTALLKALSGEGESGG